MPAAPKSFVMSGGTSTRDSTNDRRVTWDSIAV